ncbi:MAG: NAD-dependent epimerase/dehydratase family protein [Gaiellales bacterium]
MKVLVTGGCGFFGTNLVEALARRGDSVVVLDNLARRGSERNRDHLAGAGSAEIHESDIRDPDAVIAAFAGCDAIVHLAGQVAVTTSVTDPRTDFEVNAAGTLNVLEAARLSGRNPVVLFASTNKVYGGMEEAGVVDTGERYAYADLALGVPETTPLDFHSPYGCSKGAADQYVRDYARIYGIPTAVFRMSCLYGPHQLGNEDQGWLAHFAIRALRGEGVTIFGDGKQVRDVLFVDDVVDVYLRALDRGNSLDGEIVNIGGGPERTLTLLELIAMLEERTGRPLEVAFEDWRPGDQRVYISDVRRAKQVFGWEPTTDVGEGVDRLVAWIAAQPYLVG